MAQIINGKEVAMNVRKSLKTEVDLLRANGIIPKFAVIMVGDNSASKIYIKNKTNACNELGIECEEYILSETTNMEELLDLINSLNKRNEISGILLQSPIPKHLDIDKAFKAISPSKDVDGFNPENVGKLCLNQDCFISCTPNGVMKLLEEYKIDIEGKNAVVIGRSNIVGKPMLQCLLNKNATVTICHSKTKNLTEITKKADILVAAIGKPNFVTKDMVKEDAVVIDVGINRMEDGSICGDVDFKNVSDVCSYITPVPGGVGPMTVAMLMSNIVKAVKN
ncbi:MAG: bifunctional methylenetetrahydrofolate dehydrogenase/methenyltetrahydrofolate cyclohydrolase FolD [Lachnospiraceae bacterium]|jgi:methylenetetrahydrofolate dehydrogenase (NADP+)/methenyltetrahydrofolate cyclohydrolase|nr:bifunctional methylenetetrahydrofolate dehydrogenase/methenyltetrahydrofolate cyclohydrolase FolD [Lachnospiraceae bacterium]